MPLTQVQGGMLAGSTNTTTTIQSNGTTAITIDSSQNVGVGSASSGNKFEVAGSGMFSGAVTTNITGTHISYQSGNSQIGAWGPDTSTNGTLVFFSARSNGVNGLERMRIDTDGNILLNGTSSAGSNVKIQAYSASGNGAQGWIGSFTGGSGGGRANQNVGYMIGQADLKMYADWDGSGNPRNKINVQAQSAGVQLTSGATSWSTLSDERKKDIIEPITNAVNKVSTLRTVIGKYKNDEATKRRAFLIAQDVQAVLPEAVVIEDEGKDTEQLFLAYTDVIPLLVASIQELNVKVEAQAAEIAALKAAP